MTNTLNVNGNAGSANGQASAGGSRRPRPRVGDVIGMWELLAVGKRTKRREATFICRCLGCFQFFRVKRSQLSKVQRGGCPSCVRTKHPVGGGRVCTKCGTWKAASSFSISRKLPSGLQSQCSECKAEQARFNRTTIIGRAKNLLSSAKSRAAADDLPFGIDVNWVVDRLNQGVCEVSGLPFAPLNVPGRHWNSPSIDQIIAGEGYPKSNSRLILDALNRAFSDCGERLMRDIFHSIESRCGGATCNPA